MNQQERMTRAALMNELNALLLGPRRLTLADYDEVARIVARLEAHDRAVAAAAVAEAERIIRGA